MATTTLSMTDRLKQATQGVVAPVKAWLEQYRDTNPQSYVAAKRAAGGVLIADALFGLENPFDGQKTRPGIWGRVKAVGFLLVFGVVWAISTASVGGFMLWVPLLLIVLGLASALVGVAIDAAQIIFGIILLRQAHREAAELLPDGFELGDLVAEMKSQLTPLMQAMRLAKKGGNGLFGILRRVIHPVAAPALSTHIPAPVTIPVAVATLAPIPMQASVTGAASLPFSPGGATLSELRELEQFRRQRDAQAANEREEAR